MTDRFLIDRIGNALGAAVVLALLVVAAKKWTWTT